MGKERTENVERSGVARKRRKGKMGLKGRLKRLESEVLHDVELKYEDLNPTDPTAFSVSETPTGVAVCILKGGLEVNGRVGQEVRIKSMVFNYTIEIPATHVSPVPSHYNIAIVYDKSPNGLASPPAWNQVFSSNTTTAMNNLNRKRFQVLYQARGYVAPGSPGATDTFYKKLNHLQQYSQNDATTTLADIQQGAFYLLNVGSANDSINYPLVRYSLRFRYTDA